MQLKGGFPHMIKKIKHLPNLRLKPFSFKIKKINELFLMFMIKFNLNDILGFFFKFISDQSWKTDLEAKSIYY